MTLTKTPGARRLRRPTGASKSLLANVLGGLLIWFRGRDGAVTAPVGLGWGASGVTGHLPRHDHDCGPEDHGLMMFGTPLVVADQAAVTHQPSEGSLDDPAAGHHDESAGVVAAFDHGDTEQQHPGRQLTRRLA